MSINKAIISGNLTRDPELRATASGMPVLSFSVAVNDRVKNKQTGEWETRPNYVDCTMFGARAEWAAKQLEKGSKVAVEGKLRWQSWERDGQRHTKLSVTVDEIELFIKAPKPQPAQQPVQAPQAVQQQPIQQQMPVPQQAPVPVVASLYDEDIPF